MVTKHFTTQLFVSNRANYGGEAGVAAEGGAAEADDAGAGGGSAGAQHLQPPGRRGGRGAEPHSLQRGGVPGRQRALPPWSVRPQHEATTQR